MNGRIYDPTLGRFLQADPFIQAPKNSQNYNRYSYVLNNPLRYTDPSGYISVSKIVKQTYKSSMMLDGRYTAHKFTGQNPALHNIGVTALNFIPYFGAFAAAHANFDHALVNTGSLKAAATAGGTSLAISGVFYGIGQGFNGDSRTWNVQGGPAHIAAHAVAGGIISDLQGGKFGHGFWSAGLTKAANVNGMIPHGPGEVQWNALRVIVAATIGGTISEVTGGKFANGAATAAFAQAYNGNESDEKEIIKLKVEAGIDDLIKLAYIENEGLMAEIVAADENFMVTLNSRGEAVISSSAINRTLNVQLSKEQVASFGVEKRLFKSLSMSGKLTTFGNIEGNISLSFWRSANLNIGVEVDLTLALMYTNIGQKLRQYRIGNEAKYDEYLKTQY